MTYYADCCFDQRTMDDSTKDVTMVDVDTQVDVDTMVDVDSDLFPFNMDIGRQKQFVEMMNDEKRRKLFLAKMEILS